jgi:prepilin-type N-terminal cleavage/methylation domain-containing protein
MSSGLPCRIRSQAGYTLVELIIALAISGFLMVALTSVVLTAVRAAATASNRVEASGQIRSFQSFAADDFARSGVPDGGGCGTPATPCTTQPIVLVGTQVSNSTQPAASTVQVTYTWDGSSFVDRQVGGGEAIHAATDVTAFLWYVDSSAAHPTVVVSVTVKVGTYSESQEFRFYPRLNP